MSQLSQKERETFQFVTESSHWAGADFQPNDEEINSICEQMKDLDNIDEIQLVAEGFKYKQTLQQLFQAIQDPFDKEFDAAKLLALEAGPVAGASC